MDFRDAMEWVGRAVDAVAVAAIVLGIAYATVVAVFRDRRVAGGAEVVLRYRRRIGNAILLGLELLIAADIIRTVAVEPTFENVGVLAVLVLVRTFLSFVLELELSGRWPWKHG